MRTSAPGISERRAAGFTLIEVMVVMLIVAVAIAGVSVSLDALAGRETGREIERLQRVLEASAERAEIRGQPLAIEFLADGYRFFAYAPDDGWQLLHDPPVFAERLLPEGIAWHSLSVDARRIALPGRLVFGTRAPRFLLELRTGDTRHVYRGNETGRIVHESLPGPGAPS